MFHPLARKHYLSLENSRYPIAKANHIGDSSLTYLNLNINSLCTGPYTSYPTLKNQHLAAKYLEILQELSYLPKTHLVTEDNILFTNGSSESIDLLIRAFCEPGNEAILVTPPTFPYYAYRAQIENVEVIKVPLTGDDLNSLNLPDLLAASNAKLLFLCSPNNPVGTTLKLSEIESLAQKFNGIIVVDEAYIEWTEESSCIEWINRFKNLVVLRTFSKIWGLAGVRCGVTIASAGIIEVLRFAQNMFGFPIPSADLVMEKMKDFPAILNHKAEMIQLRHDFFLFLNGLSFVEKVYPGTANFLFVRFQDAHAIEQHLLNEGILVSNTSGQITETLRISIGSPKEMSQLKGTFQKCLKQCPEKQKY